MRNVSAQLSASIEASRLAFDHNLTKGEAVESAMRSFFRKHLPDSIGVAHGQVIDRHGSMSKQHDVILYDARRTPILFADEESEHRIVPIEGVIAVVEAKTNIQSRDIQVLIESARTLKGLDRSAYYFSDSPIQNYSFAYGRRWPVLPPMYFVLSFDGPLLSTLAEAMVLHSLLVPLEQRIDMVCVLQRGVIANSDAEGGSVEALPFPGSKLLAKDTKHPLLLFFILLSRYVLQADLPPIAIQQYIPAEHEF